VPFFTPRGGMSAPFGRLLAWVPHGRSTQTRFPRAGQSDDLDGLRRARLRSRLTDLRTGLLVAALAIATIIAAVDTTLA
jgi:hypothetical protein